MKFFSFFAYAIAVFFLFFLDSCRLLYKNNPGMKLSAVYKLHVCNIIPGQRGKQ